MTTPRKKAQSAEKAITRHRQRFAARAIHALILSPQHDPGAAAMGRWYHGNYCSGMAIEERADGDLATAQVFQELAQLCAASNLLYTAVNETQARGDLAAFNTLSLEFQAILTRLNQQPTPHRPPRPRQSKAPRREALRPRSVAGARTPR